MKLISSAVGFAAIKVVGDEVTPERGLLQRSLIDFVGNSYLFSSRPSAPESSQVSILPVLSFQSGVHKTAEREIVISQILMFSDGDCVVASSTDDADLVMDDLVLRLNESIGYRFTPENTGNRIYTSAIVVELDGRFVSGIETFNRIEVKLTRATNNSGLQYKFKRLSFGQDSSTGLVQVIGPNPSVMDVINKDFSLERRANSPMDREIFFSTAPLTTTDHIQLLTDIEAELIGR